MTCVCLCVLTYFLNILIRCVFSVNILYQQMFIYKYIGELTEGDINKTSTGLHIDKPGSIT